MKNFPSALIKQKNTRQGLGDSASSTLKNIGSKVLKNIFGGGGDENISLESINQNISNGYEVLDIEHEIDNININMHHKPIDASHDGDVDSIINRHNQTVSLLPNLQNGKNNAFFGNNVYFEDPFLFSSSIFGVINNYKYILGITVPTILEHPSPKDPIDMSNNKQYKGDFHMGVWHNVVAPSLFNPYNGINVTGITENVALVLNGNDDLNGMSGTLDNGWGENPDKKNKTYQLNALLPKDYKIDEDVSDCTIKKLVELSNKDPQTRELGMATYRYADFMFCKDLGKISNNHLITLRKFPGPVGDNIFRGSYPSEKNPFATYPDVGRLVTWFGTEDNKLENICRFNYNATWKEFHAEIQQKASEQSDDGWVDKIANTFSPRNNKLVSEGFSSNTGLLGWVAGQYNIPIIGNDKMSQARYGWELLSNYDQNRIYTPVNTIWDTHKYEGRLVFNQDITLTFRYVLRSYDNINPKSAFLDLLGNIMLVTYRRGTFWGGETKIYGPQGNNSVYETANAWIDKGFDKLGGIWSLVSNGDMNLGMLQGWLSNVMESAKDMLNKGADTASSVVKAATGTGDAKDNQTANEAKDKVQKHLQYIEKLEKKFGFTNALKGMLKNQLGRPAMYAFNSLLSGEEVGPWHLTIGNPRNPIMSMGNMIMTGAEITQSGALGLDDFPSEIKLVVTLKHGRPRDAVEIEKMYTKGVGSIYKPMNMLELSKFNVIDNPAFGDIAAITNNTDRYITKEEFNNKKQQAKDIYNSETTTDKQKDEAKKTIQSVWPDDILQKILRNI